MLTPLQTLCQVSIFTEESFIEREFEVLIWGEVGRLKGEAGRRRERRGSRRERRGRRSECRGRRRERRGRRND